MPIISAFPTGESTVDYTGPKSGLPSLEEGKVAYVTDEKRLYTGNADGTNTQIPNADDLSAHTSNKENPHGVTAEQVGADAKGTAAQALTDAKVYTDGAVKDKVRLVNEDLKAKMPTSGSWYSVCYGDSKFVAVLLNSNIAAYSTDGINWTQATLPAKTKWYSVCYGNGKFVAVTLNSNIAAYSTDGITWTQTSLPSSSNWYSVCYGNGKFVAVANGSNVAAYSTDGIKWIKTTLPVSKSWQSVCYGNDKFVVVVNGSNVAAYSTDGINWTQTKLPSSSNWHSVCYGNGKFVTVIEDSNIAAYSTDGITWTNTSLPVLASWTSVCYGNDKFVAVSSGNTVAYSTDGIRWIKTTLPDYKSWNSVCYGNGKFVSVNVNSDIAAFSTDGITWANKITFLHLQNIAGEDISNDVKNALNISSDDVAGSAVTPNACKVTLTASGWDSSAKTQSATVSGVLEDESKQLIMPMPAGTSMSAYNAAGIQMTAQAANTVTFTADTVPTADVEVWVVVQTVNDVTPPTLDQASWDYISKQSLAGNAKNLWAVGDCKKIKLSGNAGILELNTELYVYILDFDHDSSTVGGTKDGITFGTFKTALTGGLDICLDDSTFTMNPYPDTNSGGWKNSNMRYSVLGSTNVQNGDATATTATSPAANSLMSCLPADLRAVMRPMCIYTDNTGGGSDTASYVTATIDFLPLLAEFEIHGARTYANSAEQNNQAQYEYFKNGNIDEFDIDGSTYAVKYKYTNRSVSEEWLCRSPDSTNSTNFCCVDDSGTESHTGASLSNDVAPIFKV